MGKTHTKRETIFSHLGWKHIVGFLVCSLLFLSILLLNLHELMKLGAENAYRNCQNSYLLASSELDNYLRLADNAIESVSRRIEEMRAGGASDAEILAYMERETGTLDSRIAGPTTGVYGFINGVYLDGTGWTPEPGYQPTQRPWYVGAAEGGGSVTHIPPFANLQTGSTTITVAKLLSDGVSVVAMDLPTDNLQQLVSELAAQDAYHAETGASDYRLSQIFVMSANGTIIAHSDRAEVMKNYAASDEPFARELARRILTEGSTFFEIENGGDRLIYIGGRLGSWYVFSALGYGEVTRQIMRNLYLSAVVAVAGVAGMTVVMVRLSVRRRRAAEAKSYASRMEAENRRLAEQAESAMKIAELTKSVAALLSNMPGMTSSKEVESGEYLACNQAFAEFAGLASPEEIIGRTDRDLFGEETAARWAEDDKKALSMDGPYNFYEVAADAAGGQRQFQTTKLKFVDAAGRLCTLCMRMDYTELARVRSDYEKAQSESTIFSHIAHALAMGYSYLYYVNIETDDFIKYNVDTQSGEVTEEIRGKDFFSADTRRLLVRVHEDDQDFCVKVIYKEKILQALEQRGSFSVSYRVVVDGSSRYASMRALPVQGDAEHLLLGVSWENIEARSSLTGNYLETPFMVHARDLIKEHPTGWCLIAIDIEHFKLFNEWYGRDAGDTLLSRIGKALLRTERETGGLSGYRGQDDFCLLVPYDEQAIQKLFRSTHQLVMEYGTSVGFMPAFGVCMADANSTVEELFDRAAQASHHAKEDYHRRVRVFEESMYKKTEQDYQILSDFQLALQNQELFIMLQPQCEIEGGRVVGAESLVRWRKADGTMVSPGVFVPVLEQYGFVTDLDQFVWDEVCAWQRKWIDEGHTPLPVSVNVSQIDIFAIDVPAFFDLLLWKYKLPVDVIKIEITESAYVGDKAVADTVRRLREKGFLVLMDDFGSGYSSLNMLRSLNVDIIKLDAKFLRMNSDDRKGVQILESIVGMAKSMEAPIIVEGVETEEETAFIKSLGCRYVQGYHFYRPMPVPDFEALIGDENNIDTGGFRLL